MDDRLRPEPVSAVGRGARPGFRRHEHGALELLRLHVEALFTCDAEGRLVRVNEPAGAAAPRVFVGVCPEGVRAWYRRDLEPEAVRDLEELCDAFPPGSGPGPRFGLGWHLGPGSGSGSPSGSRGTPESPLVRRLAESAPVTKVWTGPAFRFPREIRTAGSVVSVTRANAAVLEPLFSDWLEDLGRDPPFVAVLRDGKAVSICCSVRVTDQAHEAGVETHPDFRGRGYAAEAAAAWAGRVRETGAIPLYSTSWINTASLAVAKKLGLVQFAEDLHMT